MDLDESITEIALHQIASDLCCLLNSLDVRNEIRESVFVKIVNCSKQLIEYANQSDNGQIALRALLEEKSAYLDELDTAHRTKLRELHSMREDLADLEAQVRDCNAPAAQLSLQMTNPSLQTAQLKVTTSTGTQTEDRQCNEPTAAFNNHLPKHDIDDCNVNNKSLLEELVNLDEELMVNAVERGEEPLLQQRQMNCTHTLTCTQCEQLMDKFIDELALLRSTKIGLEAIGIGPVSAAVPAPAAPAVAAPVPVPVPGPDHHNLPSISPTTVPVATPLPEPVHLNLPSLSPTKTAPNASQRRILILGDSHARDISRRVNNLSKSHIVAQGICKPHAKLSGVVECLAGLSENLSERDLVVILGGTNDINGVDPYGLSINRALLKIKEVADKTSCKLLIGNIPYRYDQPCLNNDVWCANEILRSGCTGSKVTFMETVFKREQHSNHGLHLNGKGKQLLAMQIVKTFSTCNSYTPTSNKYQTCIPSEAAQEAGTNSTVLPEDPTTDVAGAHASHRDEIVYKIEVINRSRDSKGRASSRVNSQWFFRSGKTYKYREKGFDSRHPMPRLEKCTCLTEQRM